MKSAESVTPNHPDKLCDRISDAILDEALRQDPMARVAIETMGGHGIITITGEMTTTAFVDVQKVVKSIVGDKYGVTVNIQSQSPEIAQGVDTGGAGDQGIMVGYACNDNEAMIPRETWLARHLCQTLYSKYPYDGKTQITLDKEGFIKTIVASFQYVSAKDLKDEVLVWLHIIANPKGGIEIFCNRAGDWNIGGFEADTGVTGRKLMVDNYGPQIAIGGGCFSGKDATKVDRSAAYMARKIAVQLLKQRNAKEVIVKLAYAIGVAEPVMATACVDGVDMDIPIQKEYNLTPKGIIETLDLRRPQFERLAAKGHFGTGNIWDK